MTNIQVFCASLVAATLFGTIGSLAQDGPFEPAERFSATRVEHPVERSASEAKTVYYGSISVKISGNITAANSSTTQIVCAMGLYSNSHGVDVNGTRIDFEVYDNASAVATITGTSYECTPTVKYKWSNLLSGNEPGVFVSTYMFDTSRPSSLANMYVRSSQGNFMGYFKPSKKGTNVVLTTSIGL